MKRDWDTVREILMRLETKGPQEHSLRLSSFPEGRREEISYHVELLEEAGLMYGHMSKQLGTGPHDFAAVRLTWRGHELLDAIKNDTVWKKTKESFISKGLSMTFDLLRSVAISFAIESLKKSVPGLHA